MSCYIALAYVQKAVSAEVIRISFCKIDNNRRGHCYPKSNDFRILLLQRNIKAQHRYEETRNKKREVRAHCRLPHICCVVHAAYATTGGGASLIFVSYAARPSKSAAFFVTSQKASQLQIFSTFKQRAAIFDDYRGRLHYCGPLTP